MFRYLYTTCACLSVFTFGLMLAACGGQPPPATQLPPATIARPSSQPCAAITADPNYPLYAANATYIDPSPLTWETAEPGEVGFDAARLEVAANEAGLSGTLASLLVIRHGKLVFERYFNGSDLSQANNVQSLSKSILSILTGIALAEGLVRLDMPIAEVLPPEMVGSNGDLNVQHLLTMAGGLELRDNEAYYEYDEVVGEPSFVRVVLARPRITEPGTQFAYSTGLTQVLAAVIAEAAGIPLCDYATARLFAPLGIDVDHWLIDPDGYYAGGHSTFLTPREIGRFGQFVLQGGVWEGQELVPADWLTESLEMVWDLRCRPGRIGYGYLWWLEEVDDYRVWSASGHAGQNLHIVPDLDLLLVVTQTTQDDDADNEIVPSLELLQRYIIPAVTDTTHQNATSECERPGDIVTIRPDGSGRTVLLPAASQTAPWSWSPDSSRIALQMNRELNLEIYTMAADGSDLHRLTYEFAADIAPAWSPDGTAIAFSRGDPERSDLYQVSADGSSIVQLTNLEGYEHSPTWSPDGKSIAFIHGEGSTRSFGENGVLWVIKADGTQPQMILDQPAGSPSWSPAGRWIVFESRAASATILHVIDLESGTVTPLGPGYLPRWSPDGSRLVFASDRTGNSELFVMDADGSNVYQLTRGPEFDTLPSWSPDGETLLYVSFP